jgi:hypothetical protein
MELEDMEVPHHHASCFVHLASSIPFFLRGVWCGQIFLINPSAARDFRASGLGS